MRRVRNLATLYIYIKAEMYVENVPFCRRTYGHMEAHFALVFEFELGLSLRLRTHGTRPLTHTTPCNSDALERNFDTWI